MTNKIYKCTCGYEIPGVEKVENGVRYTEYKCPVCDARHISRLDRIALRNAQQALGESS